MRSLGGYTSRTIATGPETPRLGRPQLKLVIRWVSGGLAFFALLWARSQAPARAASPTPPLGSIAGVVRLSGKAPQPRPIEITADAQVCAVAPHFEEALLIGPQQGIANAVVSIADASAGAQVPSPPVAKAVRMQQHGCRYEPHVLAFAAGTVVEIVNADGILHNVHTHSKLNRPINLAQPGFKKILRVKLNRPEAVHVTCDEHNWMSGWWFIAANPYYAVTDRAGHYEINDVPAGHYRLGVWQEELGTLFKPVIVEAGRTATVDFARTLTEGAP